MTQREVGEGTTTEGNAGDGFEDSVEHDLLMAELDVRYYTTSAGLADCGARMGSFCGRFLFEDLQVSPELSDVVREAIEKELAWFQDQWAKRMGRLGKKLQAEYRLDETPRPAYAFTKNGVFFMMGTGRGPLQR